MRGGSVTKASNIPEICFKIKGLPLSNLSCEKLQLESLRLLMDKNSLFPSLSFSHHHGMLRQTNRSRKSFKKMEHLSSQPLTEWLL